MPGLHTSGSRVPRVNDLTVVDGEKLGTIAMNCDGETCAGIAAREEICVLPRVLHRVPPTVNPTVINVLYPEFHWLHHRRVPLIAVEHGICQWSLEYTIFHFTW